VRHAARHQFVDLLFKVLLNFFGEIAVETAAGKQLLDPIHDSPDAKGRLTLWAFGRAGHSCRNATIGSIRVARRAGM
jgi:hypothetical protein